MAERDEELGIDFTPALAEIDKLDARIDDLISKVSDGLGEAFSTAFSALDAPIKLNVDDSEVIAAEDQIASLDTNPVVVPVLADAESLVTAEADIESLIAAGQLGAEVPITVDDEEVQAAESLIEDVRSNSAEPIVIPVEVDDAGLQDLPDQIDRVSSSASGADVSLDGLGGSAKEAGAGLGEIGAATLGVKGLGSALGSLGGGPTTALIGVAGLLTEGIDLAIKADAAVRRLAQATGVYAESIDALDQTDLNKSLSEFSLQIGADDDQLRVFAARFFQAGTGAGVAADSVNRTTQNLIEFAGQLSVANPQLGKADEFVGNLANAFARGGRALLPYGIAITTAEIQVRALADTHKAAAADLSIFDKQVAGTEIAIERYGTKFKDTFDEGLDSPLVKLRVLKQTLEEALEAAGRGGIDKFLDSLTAAVPILTQIIELVGTLGSVGLPLLAGGFEFLGPLLGLVAKVLNLIPSDAIAVTGAFVGLTYAAIGLGEAVALIAPSISAALIGFAPIIAAAGAIVLLVVKIHALVSGQKEAEKSSGAFAAALSAGAAAAQKLIGPTTSAAQAQQLLATSIQEANKATAADKLKPYADAISSLGLKTEDLTGLLGDQNQVNASVVKLVGNLAVTTKTYKGNLDELDLSTDKQIRSMVDQIRSSGKLDDANKALLDQAISLTESRRLDTEALRDLARAGDQEAQGKLVAIGATDDTTASNFRFAQSILHAAEEVENSGSAADKAAREQDQLNAALHATADGFVDLESEIDKTLGLFDKLAGRPLDISKALIDVKDKTADFAKSLAAPAIANAAAGASSKAAELAVTKAQDALKAAQAKATAKPSATADTAVKEAEGRVNVAEAKLAALHAKTGAAASSSKDKLDLNTQAGRDNVKSLTAVLESLRAVTDAQIKGGDSVEKATKSYSDQIDGLRKVATQAGLSKTQFDALLTTLGATPKQIETDLTLAGVDQAQDALKPYAALLDTLPEPRQTEIRQLGAVDSAAAVKLLNDELDKINDKEVKVKIIGEFVAAQISQLGNTLDVVGHRTGAIDFPMHYAQGGVAHIAAAGSNERIFGEPDTQGEAFIPLAADSRRSRAIDITSDVAGRFGFDLVQKGPMTAPGFDDSRMVNVLAQGFQSLQQELSAVRDTVGAMEAGVTVNLSGQGQSPEAQGARAGQAFRQVARSR